MIEGIDHPDHYGGGDNPYETIKVLRATMAHAEFQGFCKGNVIKYAMRAGKKGGADQAAIDLKKARDYLDFALEAIND